MPVLSRNFLHDAIREKSGKDADSRRVPGKELTRECINVVFPALVRTRTGELVFILTASDFTVTDDGIVSLFPNALGLLPDQVEFGSVYRC